MTWTHVALYLGIAFGVNCLIREQCTTRAFAVIAALLWPLLLMGAVLRFVFSRPRWL